MTTPTGACVIAMAAGLLGTAAQAATLQTLEFTGVALPGATGQVFPYNTGISEFTSFEGEPVAISLALGRTGDTYYVSHFNLSWSDDSYSLPFLTDWLGDGASPADDPDTFLGFLSQVDLDQNGGSIHITPTPFFLSTTNADFDLTLNFAFSQPRSPFASFTDDDVTGGGAIDAFVTFVSDPNIGDYDADSELQFALTGLRATAVPEPATWALMILGFAGLGLALRRRGAGPGFGVGRAA